MRALRDRLLTVVAVCALLGACLGVALASLTGKTYVSSTTQYLVGSGVKTADQLVAVNTLLSARANTYIGLVTSHEVLNPVVEDLGLDMTVEELADHVTATIAPETLLLQISVSDGDPQRAAQIAGAIAKAVANYIPAVENLQPAGVELELVTVDSATVPTNPSGPSPLVDGLIGLAAGAILGYAVVAISRGLTRTPVSSTAGDVEADRGVLPKRLHGR